MLRYQNQSMASHFLDTVQRDVENLRNGAEAERAFDADYPFSLRREQGPDGAWYTSQFAFPTLAEGPSGDAARDTVAIVVYHVTPTGETVPVGDAARPTYRAQRYVYRRGDAAATPSGGSGTLVDFDVALFEPGGRRDTANAQVRYTPPRVHVAVVAAAPLPDRRTHDEAGATPSSASRHARTVRVTNAGATGGDPPVDSGEPGSVPPLPGDS